MEGSAVATGVGTAHSTIQVRFRHQRVRCWHWAQICVPACSCFRARREGRLYMAWLTEQLGAAGGRLLPRRVAAVEELAGYDAVVNCSGGQGRVGGWGWAGSALACAGPPRIAAVRNQVIMHELCEPDPLCSMSPPLPDALCCTVQGWAPATCLATPACTRCGGTWCGCGPPGCGTTSMQRPAPETAT